MKFLKVYKNGVFYGRKLSVEHLYKTLEYNYINVVHLKAQGSEIARIKADNDVYQMFK